MSDWQRAGDAGRMLFAGEQQAVEDVLRMAVEFAELPIERRAGYLVAVRGHTSPYQRWFTVTHTPPEDRAWRPLLALLDALVADGEGMVTSHGWFDPVAATAHGGRLMAGNVGIQFPDGDGNYRAPGSRHARAEAFVPRAPEWWQMGGEAA